jgi:two-component system, NarL family, sensor histidine kinase UhpB
LGHPGEPVYRASVDTQLRGHAIANAAARGGSSGDRSISDTVERTFRNIPAIVYVWSVTNDLQDMVEEYVGPQIEQVLGFRAEEWQEDPELWAKRLHPEDRDEVMDELARSVEAGEGFRLEYRMLARDGRVVWLHDVASVVDRDAEGRVIRYEGVQLDITDRKEAEHEQLRTLEQLRRIDRERRDLLRQLVGAQDEERRRISEGIHDDVMQRLYEVQNHLGALVREHPEVEAVISGVDAEISDLAVRLRRLAFDLHPRIIGEHGLEAAFATLIERSSVAHPDMGFQLHWRVEREPSNDLGLVLYRAAAEALSNAARHSGAATVSVRLEDRASGVALTVEDDGRGFTPDATATADDHLGLASIRERAEALGGMFQVDSRPGAGTTLELWLPGDGTPAVEPAADDGVDAGPSAVERLSPREQEVAELLALGHTNSEIGSILRLSVRTVEHHRSRVMRKLGVGSRAGVVKALGVAREAQRALHPERRA